MNQDRDIHKPVLDPSGTQHWFNSCNLLHREDGPAVIDPDGTVWWWLEGQCYFTFGEWLGALDVDPKTKTLLALKWGAHCE